MRVSAEKNVWKKAMILAAAGMLCIIVSVFMLVVTAVKAQAESVTDTITIKVGYWGMDEEEYAEKATFHWTDLDDAYGGALQTHEEVYSFFRDAEKGTYSTVIVSARGFYLADLLSYANVNMSDIENISFYTKDHENGAFTSFTYWQLFEEPRYYFEDLPSKIRNKYNKAGILTGYELDDSVWDSKYQVGTMLALESNWEQYDAGTEHAFPNFENMGAGTRFRLLFGQNEPTEGRTNQSAKYVHTIAITIPGGPKVKPNGSGSGSSPGSSGPILLSKKVGKHTVTFDVAADEAMRESIMSRLVWQSSDETVLKIGDINMTPSSQYNDAVTVTINYEVLREGNATISGNYMGVQLQGESIETSDKADPEEEPEPQDPETDKDKDKDKDPQAAGGSGKDDKGGNDRDQGQRKLSLVQSGGTISRQPAASAAPEQDAPRLVSMDLDSIFNPEDETVIVRKDHTKAYIPFICTGLGGLLMLGGAASMLQFQTQTGALQIRTRRRA